MRRRFVYETGHWTNPGSPPFGAQPTKKHPTGVLFLAVVIPEGVEPSIFWMRTRRPRPLDDGTNTIILTDTPLFCKSKEYGIIFITFSGINRYESGVNIK